MYKLFDNRLTRVFRPSVDRFLASTKIGCQLYNLIANYESPIIRHILHSQSSKSLYAHTVTFGKNFFVLNFVDGKILVPLRSSSSGFDWDTALSVLGHDIEVKEVYRIYLSTVKSPRFFDIGANFGTHTALFLANQAEVYSFEPLPQCKQYFLELCRINGWNYNNWHETALSNKDGVVTITYPKNEEWLATIVKEKKSNEENPKELESKQVRISCFDNLRFDCKNALLKIDTEGHEVSVLKGSLQSNINESFGIVFESNENNGRNQIMNIANKLNFSILELKQTGNELSLLDVVSFRESQATNFFMGSDRICSVLIKSWKL